MRRAIDIAEYIVRQRGPMDAMKLQKLVYYAQAWSLALRGEVLFDEPIQAWTFGPVTYSLFDRHRGRFVVSCIDGADAEALSTDERRLVDGVLSHYGHLDGLTLSKLTHEEEPWCEARRGVPEGQPSRHVVDRATMQRYYAGRPLPFAW